MAARIPVQVVISAVDNASKTFKQIGKNVAQQSVDWTKLSLAVSGATVAMGAAITKFARDASKTEAVRSAFKVMTRGVVDDSDEFIRAVKRASAGTLSQYDILINANRALSLIGKQAFGKDFTGTFVKAMGYVRKASRATGFDIKYLTDSFVLGLGRQSKLILDNLGITTNLTKAYEDFAKTIGKEAKDLTDLEKKTAGLNYVMGLLEEKYGGITTNGQTLDEQMQALGATWKDVRDEIGRQFIPVLSKLMKDFILPFVKNYGPKLAKLLGQLVEGFGKLSKPAKIVLAVLTALAAIAGPVALAIRALQPFIILMAKIVSIGKWVVLTLSSMNPVVLAVIAVVAALTVAGHLLYKNWDKVTKLFSQARVIIGNAFKKILELGVNFTKSLANAFFDMVAVILFLVDKMTGGSITLFLKFLPMLKDLWEKAWYDMKSILQSFRGFYDKALNTIKNKTSDLKNAINSILDSIAGGWQSLKDRINGAVEGIKRVIDNIRNWLDAHRPRISIDIDFPDLGGMLRRWKEGIGGWVGEQLGKLPGFLRGIAEQFYFIRGYLPHFQEGGIVPGAIGQPQLAVVHGGEQVVPVGGQQGVTLNVNVGIYAGSAVEKRQLATELWEELGNLARSFNKTPQELLGFSGR